MRFKLVKFNCIERCDKIEEGTKHWIWIMYYKCELHKIRGELKWIIHNREWEHVWRRTSEMGHSNNKFKISITTSDN